MTSLSRLLVFGLVLTFLQLNSYAQYPSNGLIGYWPLDGTANDESGHGHNGTISGATSTEGRFGTAYSFNGTSYIDLGNLDFSTGEYTVSGWIRTDRAAITEDWRMWISKMDASGGLFELFLRDGRSNLGGNGPGFISWNGGTGLFDIYSNDPALNLRDGGWHMMTVTFKQGTQIVFSDGIEIASANYSGSTPNNTAPVKIGGINFGPYHHPWIGDIDEVLIYNRALTASEVTTIYSGYDPSDLLFSDSFDRPDSTNLGTPWNELVGDLSLVNHELTSDSSTTSAALINGISVNDVEIQADVRLENLANPYAGLVLRASNLGFYLGAVVLYEGQHYAGIFEYDQNELAPLNLTPISSGDCNLRFEALGSRLNLYVDNQMVAQAIDHTLTGNSSIGILGSGGIYDNLIAIKGHPSLPIADDFDRPNGSLGDTIGASWEELAGSFNISNNQAFSSNTEVSVANLSGLDEDNISLVANVNVDNTNSHFAGFFARANQDGEFYLACILNTNGNFSASIYRQTSGGFVQIGSLPVTSGSGKLRFSLQGSSLMLYWNNNLLISITDTSISNGTAGLVGIGATFDNFLAQ